MTTQTILVIDDSATIRKMVDSNLSQEGYRVVLAPTGEAGLERARELVPDLILLDHQLPGTTGIEVCRKIIAFPECAQIPFVVSSTLRKQAYIEYMDVPNVVDSLPKPFKPELLKMTVANALETGAMIVASQSDGTAVPEIVGEMAEPALSGDFQWMGLREILDFLNNGRKKGMLEVETERHRVCFFLSDGHIQCVSSASFDVAVVARQLPASMTELAPLLKFTMSSGFSSHVDGLVELLDRKVLDPRILKKLLRHQAAVLARYCFLNSRGSFAFFADRERPPLFAHSPLATSLAALLVESSLIAEQVQTPSGDRQTGWIRQTLRGQNTDRAGLSAKHVQLLTLLDGTPRLGSELATRSGLSEQEVDGVLHGFLLAEWVETQICRPSRTVIAFEPDKAASSILRAVLGNTENEWNGHVVRDDLGLQLLLKRNRPNVVLLTADGLEPTELVSRMATITDREGVGAVGVIASDHDEAAALESFIPAKCILTRPLTPTAVLEALARIADTPNESPEASSGRPDAADLEQLLTATGVH